MILTLLTLFGWVLIGLTLPLVVELLLVTGSYLLLPRRKYSSIGRVPHLTIVVPAHDEQILIGDCVSSLLDSAAGKARILVVAHNCTDLTADRAARAGADVLIYDDMAAKGKGYALRHGFSEAIREGAEAVLVVDADSTVSLNLIPEVLQALSEGAAAVQCRYEMLSVSEGAKGRLSSLAFRAFTYVRPAGRARLGLSSGISGNGFALTAGLLARVHYDAFSVAEDLEYHIHMLIAGESVRFLEDAAVSSRYPPSESGEAVQQARWQGGRVLLARTWLMPLLKRVASGRLRLIEPALDLAGLPLAFGVAALLSACAIPLWWVRLYGLASLAVVTIHVLSAASAGPDFLGTIRVLATAPFYVLWKFRLIPGLLKASSTRAAWIRTER